MKYKLIIGLMLGLLLIGIVFGQATTGQTSDDKKKLTDYLGKTESESIQAIKTFGKLSKEEKDIAWASANGAAKDYFIERLSTKISEVQMQSITGSLGEFFKNNYPTFNNLLQNKGIKLENFEAVSNLAKTVGINLDNVLNVRIDSVNGFDNPLLKWAEKGNIIGDGKVWLNLEGMPIGTSSLEYNNGKFILGNKDGGKIILGEGSTNEKGEVIALSKYKDKFDKEMEIRKLGDLDLKKLQEKFSVAGLNEKGIVDLMRPTEGSFSLRNLMITGGKGEIVLSEKGFEIKGDGTKVKYGDFNFGRVEGEKSQSLVEFGFDRIMLKGTEFKREGYVQVSSTPNNFVVHFGNPDGLTNQISFNDFITPSANAPVYDNIYVGKINMWFDDSGKLTHVSRIDIANGQWLPVSMALEGKSYLADLYGNSGDSVKSLLKSANEGSVGYWDVWGKFYSDISLSNKADITPVSKIENFLNINGENFNVGGSGEVKILKELNSITGITTNNFGIEDGNGKIIFKDGNIIMPGEQSAFNNGFKVGNIATLDSRKTGNDEYSITGQVGNLITSKSDRISGGRMTLLGPAGISADLSTTLPQETIDNLKKTYSSMTLWKGDNFVRDMKTNDFDVRLDVTVPSGVSVSSDTVSKFIMDKLNNNFENKDSLASISSIISQAFANGETTRTGTASVVFKNNPGEDPGLMLSLPGQQSKQIQLDAISKAAVNDILEGSLRLPDLEKMISNDNDKTRFISAIRPDSTLSDKLWLAQKFRWPSPMWSRLYYDNLGRNIRGGSWQDKDFFTGLLKSK